jgi:hypothetical protein
VYYIYLVTLCHLMPSCERASPIQKRLRLRMRQHTQAYVNLRQPNTGAPAPPHAPACCKVAAVWAAYIYTYAGEPGPDAVVSMLAYADVCWRMLTHAAAYTYVCWRRMLSSAYVSIRQLKHMYIIACKATAVSAA